MKTAKSSRLLSLVVCLVLLISLFPFQTALAVPSDIVISQVYGGGGNSGAYYKNDFVELFNRGTTTVSLSGWSIQYASASGSGYFGSTSTQITPLSGSLDPGHYLLVQEAQGSGGTASLPTPDIIDATPISMSASGGKVALTNTSSSLGCNSASNCSPAALAMIVDLVGWGSANFYEGNGAAPATNNTTAVLRKSDGAQDTDQNVDDFVAGAPTPRNQVYPFAAVGSAEPNTLLAGDPVLLSVDVTPAANPVSTGLSVNCDLGSIGGSAAQTFFDDGSNGDDVAGDNTFTFSTTVDLGTAAGAKSLACTISDAQSRTISASINLNVVAILPIGTVNGAVGDADDGTAHRSPFAPPSGNSSGQTVLVQGVIYEKTLQATNFGGTYHGFFIQNTVATADGDPNTSDGLFVFMGTYADLIGGYVPAVGDEVIITGVISEYYNMTELSSATLFKPVVRHEVDLDLELPPVEVDPSENLDVANRYWERLQGMRVQVPQNSIVLNGRNVFSPADAEFWVARPDSTIAQRLDPYTNRAFRDAHPLDDNYDPLVWDGNGYRILMGSLGIKAAQDDDQALIAPARTFDTITNAPVGGLNYTYSKYRIEVAMQPELSQGSDPALNTPPHAFEPGLLSLADYNLENLYDYRDNPFSGCDFASDTGCLQVYPYFDDVTPAFNYVPADDAVYQARLNDIALQIVNDLHTPDILMVQEVENQDICELTGGALTCGEVDNLDGKPDVLQELALKIALLGGPTYDAAFDRDSSDLRGIAPAFMYRTDRVQLLSPDGDPILDGNPAIPGYTPVSYDGDTSNPKTLNAVYTGTGACETSWVFPRAPSAGLFRVYKSSIGVGTYKDIYVINNHFKSSPNTCVAHRTEQANYNAALVAFIQASNPQANVVTGGDLNVYPRPDDPFAPVGQPGSSDQLGSLYDPGLGLKNLWEVLLGQAPESAYSYVYLGMAQTLDQIFVNQPLLDVLEQFRISHINSDFPADYPDDVARGTSDHDPNIATFYLPFDWSGFFPPLDNPPDLNKSKAGSAVPVKFSLAGDQGLAIFAAGYPLSRQIDCGTGDPLGGTEPAASAGSSGLSYDPLVDQYNFVWKTDPAWGGTCRQFLVKLIDGTTQYLNFEFK